MRRKGDEVFRDTPNPDYPHSDFTSQGQPQHKGLTEIEGSLPRIRFTGKELIKRMRLRRDLPFTFLLHKAEGNLGHTIAQNGNTLEDCTDGKRRPVIHRFSRIGESNIVQTDIARYNLGRCFCTQKVG